MNVVQNKQAESDKLNMYFELGNDASAKGDLDASLQWFYKGLEKARELKNDLKVSEFSTLILFSL